MTDLFYFADPETLPMELYQLLCRRLPQERVQRAERYRFLIDRQQSLLGYVLLWIGACRRFHTDIRQYQIATLENGKPYLSDLHSVSFNISHCRKGVLCALDSESVGADAQDRIKNSRDIAERVFSLAEMDEYRLSDQPERYFTRIWSMKESFVKYSGVGLREDFRELDFSGSRTDCILFRGLYITALEKKEVHIAVCSRTRLLRLHTVTANDIVTFIKDKEFLS